MIYIYFSEKSKPLDSIGGFDMPAVPRIGDQIFFSYSRMINNPESYTKESLQKAKKFDGTFWIVTAVNWEASFNGDGRTTVVVKKKS